MSYRIYPRRRQMPKAIMHRGGRCQQNGVKYYVSKKDGQLHRSISREEKQRKEMGWEF